jgi:hypothetical protein
MTSGLRNALLIIVGVMVLASPGKAHAPDGTTVYTRIANWQIARPNWEAYTADLEKNTLPVLEKLLADGVIAEYGLVSSAVHTPVLTHVVLWWSAFTALTGTVYMVERFSSYDAHFRPGRSVHYPGARRVAIAGARS